jgi:hypothetical protein
MIVTSIIINTDTTENIVPAVEALAKHLHERGLNDTERLEKDTAIATERAVIVFSVKREN